MARNLAVSAAFIDECENPGWFDANGNSTKVLQIFCKFDGTNWTELTDYVESITINGSIGNMSGSPAPGTCSVVFQNKDRRFSDLYPSSPYYGNLEPNKAIKIELTITSETATIFTGKVDEAGWTEDRHGGDGSARINCMDSAGRLETKLFDKDYVYVDKKLAATSAVDSVLKTVLTVHGGVATSDVVVNGLVDVTVPYAQFRSGQSVWSAVQSIAKSSLASYCGFGADGKFYFDSRLVTGWSEPSSEYSISETDLGMDLDKSVEPLMGNHVKVRGSNLLLNSSEAIILWSLRNVKQVGKNALYPTYCWETVADGAYFLCNPAASPPVEYFARYEVRGGEVIYTQNLAITQKTFQGAAATLTTSSSELAWSPTQGLLVLKNNTGNVLEVMNIEIAGQAVVRKTLANRYTDAQGRYHEEFFNPLRAFGYTDDDLRWGRVAIAENASSEAAYGEKWLTISDDLIVEDVQTAMIADFWLKSGKDPRHRFQLSGLPFLAFLQPASVATLGVTSLGFTAGCEVVGYSHSIKQGEASTSLQLVEKAIWTQTSESVASVRRIVAGAVTSSGDFGSTLPGSGVDVTVAASDHEETTDYRCSGTADQQLIQKLANDLATAYGGGTIRLTEGHFNFSSSLTLVPGVWLEGRGSATVIKKNCNDYAIAAIGTAGAHLTNVGIRDMTITRDAADTNPVQLFYIAYASGITIANTSFVDAFDGSLQINAPVDDFCIDGCIFDIGGVAYGGVDGRGLITNNSFIDAYLIINQSGIQHIVVTNNVFRNTGLYDETYYYAYINIVSANGIMISNNSLDDCARMGNSALRHAILLGASAANSIVRGNTCCNNGQLIDRGNCESATPPNITGQASSVTVGCTFVRSSSEFYNGSYSYLFTKTAAVGSSSEFYFHDALSTADVLGLCVGTTYTLSAMVKIPSSSAIATGEVSLGIISCPSSGVWGTSDVSPTQKGAWELLTIARGLTPSSAGVGVYAKAADAAGSSETFCVDDIRLRPDGQHNEHGQNFSDAGTGTIQSGNSWNTPFPA